MYSPSFYRETRHDLILPLIERYSFATLLGGDQISHLPIIPWENDELVGHMARANPHWKALETAASAKAIFHGPHGYVSPAWYAANPENVPTWNYAIVHVTGTFEVIDDRERAFPIMRELTRRFETAYGTGWVLPENEPAIDRLMNGIVVFKLRDLQFEAKFKLSQKQTVPNRENVIKGLTALGDADSMALADYMTKTRTPEK